MPDQLEDSVAAVGAVRAAPAVQVIVDRTGDFDAFVAARGPALLRLGLLTADPHRAEDLVQSALARAYQHWGRVRRAGDPEAYVDRILVRRHLSWRRLRSPSDVVRLPVGPDRPAAPAASPPRAATW